MTLLSEASELYFQRMNVGVPPVILKAARKHTASLVFLHGLGDTGLGWAGALNTIKPDYLKVRLDLLQSWCSMSVCMFR